jgi:hypothetical protein
MTPTQKASEYLKAAGIPVIKVTEPTPSEDGEIVVRIAPNLHVQVGEDEETGELWYYVNSFENDELVMLGETRSLTKLASVVKRNLRVN